MYEMGTDSDLDHQRAAAAWPQQLAPWVRLGVSLLLGLTALSSRWVLKAILGPQEEPADTSIRQQRSKRTWIVDDVIGLQGHLKAV